MHVRGRCGSDSKAQTGDETETEQRSFHDRSLTQGCVTTTWPCAADARRPRRRVPALATQLLIGLLGLWPSDPYGGPQLELSGATGISSRPE
jgi:hypothetical protein